MIKINLVPSEILAKAQQRQQLLQFAAVGVVTLLLVVALSLMHWFKLNRLEVQYTKLGKDFKLLEVVVAKVEQLDLAAGALRARLSVIDGLLKGRPAYPRFMSDLARSVPAGVTLKSLTTTGGGSTPIKLNITAESRTSQDILAWVKNMEKPDKKLELTGAFTPPELGAVNSPDAVERVFSFTLVTTYTPQL